MGHKSKTPAMHINKRRQHAGQHNLDTDKRDRSEITLLVLECIHDQCVRGATTRDIINRCQLNYYYFKQIIEYLLQNQLVQKWDTLDNPDDDNDESTTTKFFMTQKGCELREHLTKQLKAIGIEPRLNPERL